MAKTKYRVQIYFNTRRPWLDRIFKNKEDAESFLHTTMSSYTSVTRRRLMRITEEVLYDVKDQYV